MRHDGNDELQTRYVQDSLVGWSLKEIEVLCDVYTSLITSLALAGLHTCLFFSAPKSLPGAKSGS